MRVPHFHSAPRSLLCALFTLLAAPALASAQPATPPPEPSGPWRDIILRLAPGADPDQTARALMARNLGPVGIVPGYFRFSIPNYTTLSWEEGADAAGRFAAVEWSQALRPYQRAPQQQATSATSAAPVADPLFPDLWHLQNTAQGLGTRNEDARVVEAWAEGVSGAGVTVAIVDDSVQIDHPDLASNFRPGFGLDALDNDADPRPVIEEDRHGTAVAGITLAASNSIGGAGIAYAAGLAAVRLIGDFFDDEQEVNALTFRYNSGVDIYNNSWGPSDEQGVRYAGPSVFVRDNIQQAVATGRNGLGSIYVWAAGNGRQSSANSNYDGYNALRETISVGAVGQDGKLASYSEPGANVLVVAPSQGRGDGITTTDVTGTGGYSDGDYYSGFNGTSAAAPMVSGVVALMLEANPALTWRDVQHILVLTAVKNDPDHEDWSRNGAGLNINHQYGFGRVDAAAAVRMARTWPGSGSAIKISSGTLSRAVTLTSAPTIVTHTFSQAVRAEHVRVTVNASHSAWSDLDVVLVSPSGTRSVLAEAHGGVSGSVGSWSYLSVRHWGEDVRGSWRVEIADNGPRASGSLRSVVLEIWGIPIRAGDNRPPAAEDRQLVSASFPLRFDATALASDPDGDPLQIIGISGPAHGTARILGSQIEYSMDSDYRGADRFGYTLHDGRGGTVHRQVEVINPLPLARDDFALTRASTPVDIAVLANDTDSDADPLALVGFTQGRRGSVSASGRNGTVRYTPHSAFIGWDRFSYTLSDGSDGVDTGWVTVVIDEPRNFTLRFDGVDDQVVVDANAAFDLRDRFTIEAMINPSGWGEYVTGFGRIFDKGTVIFFLNGFDHAFYNDRSLVFYTILDDGSVTAANSVAGSMRLDQWQHVAAVFDSAAASPVQLYVNGSRVGLSYPIEDSLPPRSPLSSNAADQARIGEAPSGERAFRGSISDLRVWNRPLSEAEIVANMNRELTGFENGLTALFRFDEGSGDRIGGAGLLALRASVFGAEWLPRNPPWAPILNYFGDITDEGDGWWRMATGWSVAADTFPWVWVPGQGWLYAGGSGGPVWYFYRAQPAPQWLMSSPALYPWVYSYATREWTQL